MGIPKEFFFDVVSPDVQRAFDRAISILKKGGASIKKLSLPLLPETEEAGNQITWAEATLYHQQAGWFPDRSADYGEDVRSRLELGTKVSAVSYLKALQTREKFISALHLALEDADIDALVVPTTPIAAPPIAVGTRSSRSSRPSSLRACPLRPSPVACAVAVYVAC